MLQSIPHQSSRVATTIHNIKKNEKKRKCRKNEKRFGNKIE
jgi:hypothetical protein